MPIRMVMGLGNPGPEYDDTRHNVGFDVLDRIASRLGRAFHQRGRALVARGELADGEVTALLAKPTTYMNRSGRAARDLLADAEGEVELLVVCDDFHLPIGKLRCRSKGSSGGQKGLQSILDLVPDREIPRLRLGIGEPGRMPAEDYVLKAFKAAERAAADDMLERASLLVEDWLAHGDLQRLIQAANAPVE